MTPQELKNSILQLAIQGKLVEQRPEEGTAEELYREIQKEKQALIKAGKIKKEKPLPEITEDEIPFEIPESWKWVRLGNIGAWSAGATPPRTNAEYYNGNIPWLKTGDLNDGYVSEVPESISALALEKTSVRLNPIGSVLMAMYGATIGKLAILSVPMTTNQACCACIPYGEMYNKYLFYFLMGMRKAFIKMGEGGAQPNISKDKIVNSLIPIPPLAEQKRIVAKIEELLPLIDRYEKAWTRLEEFNKRFPGDMQKSILQMAIQGKLVEQRPEEGTGEELYQQIQKEKQALIKARKIKKEKPLPEITEDEIPFEIPETWKWVKLGDLALFFDAGKSPNCQKVHVKGEEWGVITTTAIQQGFFDEIQNKILPESFNVNYSIQVKAGDILITRAGPTNRTGVACLVKEIHYNLILSDKTLRINMTDEHIFKDYIVMVLNSPQIRQLIVGLMSGMDKQQVNISQDKYKIVLIPLPPLAEQKRIVARLEELLPLCEKLK